MVLPGGGGGGWVGVVMAMCPPTTPGHHTCFRPHCIVGGCVGYRKYGVTSYKLQGIVQWSGNCISFCQNHSFFNGGSHVPSD